MLYNHFSSTPLKHVQKIVHLLTFPFARCCIKFQLWWKMLYRIFFRAKTGCDEWANLLSWRYNVGPTRRNASQSSLKRKTRTTQQQQRRQKRLTQKLRQLKIRIRSTVDCKTSWRGRLERTPSWCRSSSFLRCHGFRSMFSISSSIFMTSSRLDFWDFSSVILIQYFEM